ncbi:MAG: twin-arginine translocation signal domain-containing protein [Candidatus Omnitrophota bacterium]|jgi:hypothetical protein|nr:MAG: twin-arginine translocation signal domain-containing protein [Candidatus Omnitrophota bacterium]
MMKDLLPRSDADISSKPTRRQFVKHATAQVGAMLTTPALLSTSSPGRGNAESVDQEQKDMPIGKIGDLSISRLICGSNSAHGRHPLRV